jgi:hypothetical protein
VLVALPPAQTRRRFCAAFDRNSGHFLRSF